MFKDFVAKAFGKVWSFATQLLNCNYALSRFVLKGEGMGSMLFMFGIKELELLTTYYYLAIISWMRVLTIFCTDKTTAWSFLKLLRDQTTLWRRRSQPKVLLEFQNVEAYETNGLGNDSPPHVWAIIIQQWMSLYYHVEGSGSWVNHLTMLFHVWTRDSTNVCFACY